MPALQPEESPKTRDVLTSSLQDDFKLTNREREVLEHLALSNPEDPLPLILVHALAPSLGTVGRERELRNFRQRAYTIFQENYYTESEDVPNSNDTDAPFFPIVRKL